MAETITMLSPGFVVIYPESDMHVAAGGETVELDEAAEGVAFGGGNASETAGGYLVGGTAATQVRQSAAGQAAALGADYGRLWPARNRHDTLYWTDTSAVEIKPLAWIDGPPGVRIDFVAGGNASGTGYLTWDAEADQFYWTPPGGTIGEGIPITTDREYTIAGGESGAFIRVTTTAASMPAQSSVWPVVISDTFGGIACADLSAAEAAAGVTRDWQVRLYNRARKLQFFTIWLDQEYNEDNSVEISYDGFTYASPLSEEDEDIMLGGAALSSNTYMDFYLRRTFAAGAAPTPGKMIALYIKGFYDSQFTYSRIRGQYRVKNAPEYRLYRKLGSPPEPGVDTAFATSATLPFTPAGTWADGHWYCGVTYFDGWRESPFVRVFELRISGGNQVDRYPAPPLQTALEQRSGGVVRIHATALQEVTHKGRLPDTWAIWYTTNGRTCTSYL